MGTSNLKRIAVAAAMIACAPNASASPLLGTWLPTDADVKLWMVNLDPLGPTIGGTHGVNAVAANIPGSPADLSFQTNLIQYNSEFKPNTVQGFFVPGVVKNAAFSGLVNPLVGAAVDANTELWSESCGASDLNEAGCWGSIIEITGKLNMETGGHVKIDHDDGVSLMLSGLWADCFKDGSGQHYTAGAGIESCTYSGPSGLIDFSLVYTEGFGGPARLALAVPEPASLLLLGIAFAGLGLGVRRQQRA